MLPKGVGVAKFDLTKTFRNQLLSRVSVLYHQYSITNYSESIFKSKIMSILTVRGITCKSYIIYHLKKLKLCLFNNEFKVRLSKVTYLGYI